MNASHYDKDINRARVLAAELVGLQPDMIVTGGSVATLAVQRETGTIPIVFANAGDPVAVGIVARLDRPSGNVTGFATSSPLGASREAAFKRSGPQPSVCILKNIESEQRMSSHHSRRVNISSLAK
jgi:ABC-type uncharacterized transport system substrate-binding protein